MSLLCRLSETISPIGVSPNRFLWEKVGETKIKLEEPIRTNNVVDLVNDKGRSIGDLYVVMVREAAIRKGHQKGMLSTVRKYASVVRDPAATLELMEHIFGIRDDTGDDGSEGDEDSDAGGEDDEDSEDTGDGDDYDE
ncbi:hypothetical protein L2E82_08647 [Cichorium intybus]|uniref:Uncharacterized protein n=1 Tax=Cichorium intybus TaxID=13427 RepID=A0ACB9G7U0_CICIN|nr:hypothetical protein L2E82_08647 [Cichorium intybus]